MKGRGHLAIIMLLLAHPKIDVYLTHCLGFPPLFDAIYDGYAAVTKALLSHCDTDVNHKDGSGERRLHYAVGKGYLDIVTLILAHPKIDMNPTTTTTTTKTGRTPFHLAAINDHGDLAVLLLLLLDHFCDSLT